MVFPVLGIDIAKGGRNNEEGRLKDNKTIILKGE